MHADDHFRNEMTHLSADERVWHDAVARFRAELFGFSAAEARLRCFCDDVGDGICPAREDLEAIAAAFARVLNGDDAKKALGLAGRQHQGRPSKRLQERRLRREIARRFLAYAIEIGAEAAKDAMASQLTDRYVPSLSDDPAEALEQKRGCIERCYRELSEEERESIRAELLEDTHIALQSSGE